MVKRAGFRLQHIRNNSKIATRFRDEAGNTSHAFLRFRQGRRAPAGCTEAAAAGERRARALQSQQHRAFNEPDSAPYVGDFDLFDEVVIDGEVVPSVLNAQGVAAGFLR